MTLRGVMLWFLGGVVSLVVLSMVLAKKQVATTQPIPPTQGTQTALEGDIISEDMTLTVTNGPSKAWELNAKQAAYNRSQTEADLATVTGTFYNDEQKAVATFTAPKGHYSDATKSVTLLEDVVITATDPDNPATLKSPHITWSSRSDKISAEEGVVMVLANTLKSRGQKAQFTLDFSHVRLTGNTTTEFLENDA